MLALEILSPSRVVRQVEARMVNIPGLNGQLGVLENHADLITELGVGVVTAAVGTDQGGQADEKFFVSGGFARVEAGRVEVLSDTVDRATEIDLERARQAEARARERLREAHKGEIDIQRALKALARALYRQQLALTSKSRS